MLYHITTVLNGFLNIVTNAKYRTYSLLRSLKQGDEAPVPSEVLLALENLKRSKALIRMHIERLERSLVLCGSGLTKYQGSTALLDIDGEGTGKKEEALAALVGQVKYTTAICQEITATLNEACSMLSELGPSPALLGYLTTKGSTNTSLSLVDYIMIMKAKCATYFDDIDTKFELIQKVDLDSSPDMIAELVIQWHAATGVNDRLLSLLDEYDSFTTSSYS